MKEVQNDLREATTLKLLLSSLDQEVSRLYNLCNLIQNVPLRLQNVNEVENGGLNGDTVPQKYSEGIFNEFQGMINRLNADNDRLEVTVKKLESYI